MSKKCDIKGTIISSGAKWIYNWLGIPATSPRDIEDALNDANGDDIEFAINSGGGDVFAGSEMFTLIKKYPGNTSAEVLGIAASAASLPLCAVKTARISPTAQVMIHNAACKLMQRYKRFL
jgi:ATP-dependent protease ClpP protease subunit